MRIFNEETNSELAYNIDDVIDAINDELGFSAIKNGDSSYYFMLGSSIKLTLDFSTGETILTLPSSEYDLTDDSSEIEIIASAIESAETILEITSRMSEEDDE